MHDPDNPKTRSTEAERDESFYGRWSRRKYLEREGVLEPEPVDAAPAVAPATDAPADGSADGSADAAPPVLTDADMPDLDSLGEEDDYSPFMSPGVSEALRTKALRKLFLSSQFNVLDGLNDYDDDFTSFEALGDIITSDMRHRMEMEAEKARERAEEEARALLAGEDDAGSDAGDEGNDDERRDDDDVQQLSDAPGTGTLAASPADLPDAMPAEPVNPAGARRDDV